MTATRPQSVDSPETWCHLNSKCFTLWGAQRLPTIAQTEGK